VGKSNLPAVNMAGLHQHHRDLGRTDSAEARAGSAQPPSPHTAIRAIMPVKRPQTPNRATREAIVSSLVVVLCLRPNPARPDLDVNLGGSRGVMEKAPEGATGGSGPSPSVKGGQQASAIPPDGIRPSRRTAASVRPCARHRRCCRPPSEPAGLRVAPAGRLSAARSAPIRVFFQRDAIDHTVAQLQPDDRLRGPRPPPGCPGSRRATS